MEFLKFSSSNISDALDKLKIKGGCEGILPIIEGKKICGPAFTVKYVPIGTKGGTVGDYIDYAKRGDVIVLDNAGRKYCTVWGDLLTLYAKKKEISGTVIDGVCRDVQRIKELDYPIFTKGRFMMTGKDRVKMEAMNVPVSLSNTLVNPGDIVFGDDSGVVVIPKEREEEVLELAEKIKEAEDYIEKEIETGSKIKDAREKFGYHKLQRGE